MSKYKRAVLVRELMQAGWETSRPAANSILQEWESPEGGTFVMVPTQVGGPTGERLLRRAVADFEEWRTGR